MNPPTKQLNKNKNKKSNNSIKNKSNKSNKKDLDESINTNIKIDQKEFVEQNNNSFDKINRRKSVKLNENNNIDSEKRNENLIQFLKDRISIDPFEEKLKNKKLAEELEAQKLNNIKNNILNVLDEETPVFDLNNAKNSLKIKRPAIELDFMAEIEDKPIKFKDNEYLKL